MWQTAQFALPKKSASPRASVSTRRRPVSRRRGRKVEQFLHLGHEVNLAAALQRIDAFLGGDDRIAVEVGPALLEFGEVFDRAQSALRTEEALDIDSAQGGRVYPSPVSLRADVADQMCPTIGVAVDVAVKASYATARPFRPAILGDVELLLRKLGQQQAEPFELFRIENAVEQLIEII